jgi:hypothetical protein
MNTKEEKAYEVLAKLDGIDLYPCAIARSVRDTLEGKGKFLERKQGTHHGSPIPRFFMHSSGNVYQACDKHLDWYLENLIGSSNGGWMEYFFQ